MEDTAPDRDIVAIIQAEFAKKEAADALRHKAVEAIANEQAAQRALLTEHHSDIAALKKGSTPELFANVARAAWVIACIGGVEVLLDGFRAWMGR